MKKKSLGSTGTPKGLTPQTVKPLASRRDFIRQLTAGVGATACLNHPTLTGAGQAATGGAQANPVRYSKTESDVGSLFPFIQSQAVKSDFPLSFLNPRFKSAKAWKRKARGKLLELLHYAPPECAPRPEIVERIDKGDYIREKIY